MSWVTRLTALIPSIVGGTLMSSGTTFSTGFLRSRSGNSGPVPESRRRFATVTVEDARPAATARNKRGATGPLEGPTVRVWPANIDSTSGRFGEYPSWIIDLFRGDGIGLVG